MNADLGELYAGSWHDFVTLRGQLVAAARDAGDSGAAKVLKSLKKPTRGAWLVNLLARYQPDQLAEVLRLGEELAQAHRDVDPAEMRRLSHLRFTIVKTLTRSAVALGSERGYAAPDSIRSEVAETLQAAMGDPELADTVRRGILVATVRAAGFGPADFLASASPPTRTAPAQTTEGANVVPLRPRQNDERRGRDRVSERRLDEAAEARRQQEAAEVRRLSRELGRAEVRQEQNVALLQRAEEPLPEAQEALATSRRRSHELGVRVAELRADLAEAEARLADEQKETHALGERVDELVVDRDRIGAVVAELDNVIGAAKKRLAELGVTD